MRAPDRNGKDNSYCCFWKQKIIWSLEAIVYKKKASDTSSDNEWQRVVQRVTMSGTTTDNE